MGDKAFDKHHILPSSQGGTKDPNNIVRMDIRKHRALHMLFDNRTVPEQIDRLLSLSSTALTQEVKSDIIQILNVRDMEYWYKKGVYHPN